MARLLQSHGAEVLVSEMRSLDPSTDTAERLRDLDIAAEWGGHSDEALSRDWLIISPGIAHDAPVVQKAVKNGMQVFGELEAASWYIDVPLVAVTGSNGKDHYHVSHRGHALRRGTAQRGGRQHRPSPGRGGTESRRL